MNTTTIIPIIVNKEPAKCPNCGQNENNVLICRSCKYEYPDEKFTNWDGVKIVLIAMFVAWITITICMWMYPGTYNGHPTLFEVIKNQYKFFSKLKIY